MSFNAYNHIACILSGGKILSIKGEGITLKKTNILLIHALISDQDSWNGKVKWMSTKWLFKHTKFNVIISGDNHICFSANKKGRWILNSGSMMRKNVDQGSHKPCFFIVEIINQEIVDVKQIFIPVHPFLDIMRVEDHLEKKNRIFNMENWKDELNRKDFTINVNYKNDLLDAANKSGDEDVVNFVIECLKDL